MKQLWGLDPQRLLDPWSSGTIGNRVFVSKEKKRQASQKTKLKIEQGGEEIIGKRENAKKKYRAHLFPHVANSMSTRVFMFLSTVMFGVILVISKEKTKAKALGSILSGFGGLVNKTSSFNALWRTTVITVMHEKGSSNKNPGPTKSAVTGADPGFWSEGPRRVLTLGGSWG